MKSILSFAAAFSVAVTPAVTAAAPKVCADCVKSNMEVLTGDALRGRACGTEDENAAARFVAGKLKAYGVKGAAPDGAHLQRVDYRLPTFASKPILEVGSARFVQGEGIVAMNPGPSAAGPLAVMGVDADPAGAAGKVALLDGPFSPKGATALFNAGASAVIVAAPDGMLKAWGELAERPPGEPEIIGAEAPPSAAAPRTMIFARMETMVALKALAGQGASFSAPRGAPEVKTTYNVLGVIPGTAPDADRHAILLSAHYDHVGVRDGVIYRGANDDASGTAAVLEFARMLGEARPSKRTVHFALFGCEEQGGHGAKYFLAHPPVPLADMAANLEFEMIGLPDPQHPKTLMLTGWERSNLGPTLKARGADIGPDAYPEQNFFQRSDNYQLALKGVVAQTVSAWPVPPTYHQASDDLAHVDLDFMAHVIQSMVGPIRWLANSDFRPEWKSGMKP